MAVASSVLDATFRALADPTRRAMLARLAVGEASVTELAEPFDVSLPAISKHLRVLEDAGLLARERAGRVHRCRLAPAPLASVAEWIAHYRRFWDTQLDALDRYLNAGSREEESSWRSRPPRKKPRSASRARSRPPGIGSSRRGRTRRS
jgi:DNA-binding transcriptional ArsR family regulator